MGCKGGFSEFRHQGFRVWGAFRVSWGPRLDLANPNLNLNPEAVRRRV